MSIRREYFQELLDEVEMREENKDHEEVSSESVEGEINIEDLKEVKNHVKNGKAPGCIVERC